jgi:hypothetical protein
MISRHISTGVLTLALSAAFGLAACGGSDDQDSNDVATATEQNTTTAATNPAADRRAIRKESEALRKIFLASKAEAWCDRVSAHAAAVSAKAGAKGATCAEAMQQLVPIPLEDTADRRDGTRIGSISVTGDEAKVRLITPKGIPPIALSYVREDGQWKLNTGIVLPKGITPAGS